MPTSSSGSDSSESLGSSGSDDSSGSPESSESSDESSESSSSSSCYPSWELKTVSFSGAGYRAVKEDGTDNPYERPHWTAEAVPGSSDPNPRKYPVLYVAGTKMSLSASWQIDPADGCESTFEVKADCPDGIKLAATTATLSNDGILSIAPTEVDTAFPSSRVDRFDPMTITWYISVDGGEWEEAGTSENPVYVCLKAPIGNELYRTVVNLACTQDSPTDEEQAVVVTWEQFHGPANVKTWDNQPLYYYKAGSKFAENEKTAKAMLSSTLHTGQCNAWADLFRLALKVNGINSTPVIVQGAELTKFLISNRTFSTIPTYPATNEYLMFLNDPAEMVPGFPATPNAYGDLTSASGLAGQNSTTPSEKVFTNHRIILYDGTYYDPSYGVTYSSRDDFETKAVAGFAFPAPAGTPVPGGATAWTVKQKDGQNHVGFTNLPQ